MSVADLLGRTGLGQHDAFAELFDRTSPDVLGLVQWNADDGKRQDSFLLNVYVAVWQQSPRWQAVAIDALTWILDLADRSVVRNSLRPLLPALAASGRTIASPEPAFSL